ncbi:oxidoreductase [Mycolicibacter minnesotensis]|uniref:Oxidoreductase n=1 Tax=Mycolicibacter minnesotensis TaxID=1118379 RepID=A0AA91RLH0_9MYCO|nr:SDR family oxidoreductase [Mycolicibacter minnesotensis]ORA99581.1 oxidoreductase [Mycolicibacter minnesotensis]
MASVSVITGGAGGMGLATAKILGRDHAVVLADARRDRLDEALAVLTELGIAATIVHCDVTDRDAVSRLFDTAAGVGPLASVIHTAGVSPSMGDAEFVMRVNAWGTVVVNEVFYDIAPREGAVIVNVASMAAQLLPDKVYPTGQFPLALHDGDAFVSAMTAYCNNAPEQARSGFSYTVSKAFVKWYCASQAERFGGRGLRIVSVSPGNIDTEMGRREEKAGVGMMMPDALIARWGTAEEMAELFAFCAGDKCGYLTGADILADGGVVASMRERARLAAERS